MMIDISTEATTIAKYNYLTDIYYIMTFTNQDSTMNFILDIGITPSATTAVYSINIAVI